MTAAPSLVRAWVQASRPKTLPAAVAPVCAGCGVAWKVTGHFDLWLGLCTLLSAVAIQIGTNFFNDAVDDAKGADTAQRLGPVRASAAGLISRRSMFTAAFVTLAVACVLALPLISARGWPILAIGLPSLYFSYGYTGGPIPLAYRGLGDLWVLLFFGLIAVGGAAFVQSGQWLWQALVAGWQIGLLSTVLIAINNLRDCAEDATTGKRTLAVRFGKSFARWEIAILCLLPHALGLVVWIPQQWDTAALWPLPVLVLGIFLVWRIFHTEPSRAYNKFLALSALQLILFTGLFLAACLG